MKEVEGEWIFPKDDSKGPRVNFDKTLRLFVATLPKDIAPFSWHDLRRTCGCRLLQDYGLSMERRAPRVL